MLVTDASLNSALVISEKSRPGQLRQKLSWFSNDKGAMRFVKSDSDSQDHIFAIPGGLARFSNS
jgi:hypothetical protein